MLQTKTPSIEWANFLAQHVRVAADIVHKELRGRDMEEARENVWDFLDGYLVWLKRTKPGQLRHFKESFYASTTWIPSASFPVASTVDDASSSAPIYGKHFGRTTKPPNSSQIARRHLEAYLILWRSLYSVCETESHASNRLAQLFDWEVRNNGPICKLSRLLACPQVSDLNGSEKINYDTHGIYVTEKDISDFYQDGMKSMEARKFNLDDLQDCSNFRIKPSNCLSDNPDGYLPRLSSKRTTTTLII